MTCYFPLNAAWNSNEGGKPIIYKKNRPRPKLAAGYKPIQLACGQCDGCRIDRSKEWAARIVHESLMHPENCFVTLTYDDANLPYDGSLNKTHFQKFMKRLRKKYEGTKIRYFHAGEYGAKLSRPHYHACLFGIDFHDRVPFSVSNDVVTYTSPELQKIWGMGFTTCGELTYESAAYTARYIMKKITGRKADLHYQRIDPNGEIHELQPEYITMSLGRNKGEGIGGSFYKKYKTDFFPRDECPIPGRGVYKCVPRYYEQIFAEEDPDTWAKIKEARKRYKESRIDEYSPQRLAAKHKVKRAQLAQLPRS